MTQLLTKSLLAVSLVLGVGVASAAAQPDSPRGRRSADAPAAHQRLERRLAAMTERLSLTPAQQVQVRAIMEQTRTQMQALGAAERGRGNRQARRRLRFTTEDQLHAVLSCEQREAYRLLRRERMSRRMQQRARNGRRGRGRHHGRGAGRPGPRGQGG